MFESLGISGLNRNLSEYNLNENSLVVRESVGVIENFLIENWGCLCGLLQKEKVHIEKYICSKVGKDKNIAIIDVGWLGSGPMGLKYIIEDEIKVTTSVKCWQAAIRPPVPSDILADVQDEVLESYIFSRMHNRLHYDTHVNTNSGLNNIFFELHTQANYPSYRGISKDGNYMFDLPETENYGYYEDIQKGILDFIVLYNKTFTKDKYMFNISGYDAYCSFRMIIRDLTWIKKYFKDIRYARGIGMSDEYVETLDDLIKQQGL